MLKYIIKQTTERVINKLLFNKSKLQLKFYSKKII